MFYRFFSLLLIHARLHISLFDSLLRALFAFVSVPYFGCWMDSIFEGKNVILFSIFYIGSLEL